MTDRLTVECRGREAEVVVSGQGRDVLIVGAAAPLSWSADTSSELAALGFRVINFDYGSGHPEPEPRTSIEQAADVLLVAEAVGIETAVLVGLSRGAITAYQVALDEPHLVAGLVLAFPVAGFADTIYREETGPTGDTPAEMLRTVFSDRFLEDHTEEAAELLMRPPGSVTRVIRADETPFEGEPVVDCPVLVVEGSADQVVGPEHPRRYKSVLPEATHLVLPDASHGWLMEEPGEFARIVADFSAQEVPEPPESS